MENHLEILDTILVSTARLVVNRASLKLKYARVQQVLKLLKGAV
jgi:ATP phosphoribosyltransferase